MLNTNTNVDNVMDKLMSNNKQSSVEWFANRIKHLIPDDIGSQLFLKSQQSKATAMHKEEIVNTYKGAQVLLALNDTKRAEQFYNETFNQ
jgi:hypothetical protein